MNDRSIAKPRRSTGMKRMARAVWYVAPGKVELRTAPVQVPQPDQALVRMIYSGVSRGTERLVLNGAVGESERERMRGPLQEGSFPFPVKYGYCAVGRVERGPEALEGRQVFCLHPHQDYFVAPLDMLVPVPDAIPPRRATLAANMETALNALWDSGAAPADRIVVVGAGVVGLLIAYLAARMPGTEVWVADIADRKHVVEALGAKFVLAQDLGDIRGQHGADVVFHTSVTAAGLNAAIEAAGFEGTIVELSWYGERDVGVRLGGPFHSQRLTLISSQVGQVSARHRPRWTYRRRIEAAIRLLDDPRLDCLVATEIAFEDAERELVRVLGAGAEGLSPVIRYPAR